MLKDPKTETSMAEWGSVHHCQRSRWRPHWRSCRSHMHPQVPFRPKSSAPAHAPLRPKSSAPAHAPPHPELASGPSASAPPHPSAIASRLPCAPEPHPPSADFKLPPPPPVLAATWWLPTVFNHCTPAIRGKTTTSTIPCTCTPSLLVTRRQVSF